MMPANVEETAQNIVVASHNDQRFAHNISRNILASAFNLIETTNELHDCERQFATRVDKDSYPCTTARGMVQARSSGALPS